MSPTRASRRQHPRVPFAEKVRYFEWDRPRLGQAVGLSAGGMFLESDRLLPPGRILTLRLALPGEGQAFTALARVVRTSVEGDLEPRGMGLQFLDIPAAARSSIDRYVQGRRAA